MIRLITPPGLLVTTALLAVYSAFAAWVALTERSWLHAALAVMAIVACFGTALMKPWSRRPVYFLAAAFSLAWLHSVYAGVRAGYFEFAYSSWPQIVRALAPGFLLVCISLGCSFVVFRHFDRAIPRSHLSEDRPVT